MNGYRSVWRWHFIAGLLVAPVVLVLALTGALYLFDAEIEAAWARDLNRVVPLSAPRPLAEQEAAVRAALPGAVLLRYVHPPAADRAATWSVRAAEGTGRDVFVDPYRATVTGTLLSARRPMHIVASLHGELMAGRVGDWIVEAAACWTLVLVATGLVLWWPRRWRVRGVVVPRLDAGAHRRWRDLHAIPGAANALLVVFLVLSGLPWSGFWGERLAALGTLNPLTAPSPNFSAAPEAPAHDGHDAALPWAVRHAHPPAGSAGGTTLQQVFEIARARGIDPSAPRLRLIYPQGHHGVFTVSHVTDRAQDQRTLYVDPASAQVLDDIGWERYSPLAQAVEWGVMVHLGRQFGLANQLAGLAVCALLAFAIVAGAVHWWRRRPAGGLGTPRPAAGERLPAGLRVLILVLALLFPLVGVTLLAAWAVEALVARRRLSLFPTPRRSPP